MQNEALKLSADESSQLNILDNHPDFMTVRRLLQSQQQQYNLKDSRCCIETVGFTSFRLNLHHQSCCHPQRKQMSCHGQWYDGLGVLLCPRQGLSENPSLSLHHAALDLSMCPACCDRCGLGTSCTGTMTISICEDDASGQRGGWLSTVSAWQSDQMGGF